MERPFFSVNVTHIGDAGLFMQTRWAASSCGRSRPVRPASAIHLNPNGAVIARNIAHTAAKDAPIRYAVERSPDSLIGSVSVASAPHPERKSVLIEANALSATNDSPMAAAATGADRSGVVPSTTRTLHYKCNSETETGFNVNILSGYRCCSAPGVLAPAALPGT